MTVASWRRLVDAAGVAADMRHCRLAGQEPREEDTHAQTSRLHCWHPLARHRLRWPRRLGSLTTTVEIGRRMRGAPEAPDQGAHRCRRLLSRKGNNLMKQPMAAPLKGGAGCEALMR